MQPQITDLAREPNSPTITAERRASRRRWSAELAVTRYVVALNLGPSHRAELINESDGGIAVQVRELDRSADVGRAIDVIYRGRRQRAEVRHIARIEHGFLVGLQWKKRDTQ